MTFAGIGADLEQAIAELAACVWELPDGTRPAYAASQLADAYSDRAMLDQDDASLTLSIDTALRGLALPSPDPYWTVACISPTGRSRWRNCAER